MSSDIENNSPATSPSGRPKSAYFLHVRTLPGETEEYTLPAGCNACPVPACPAYEKIFHPHWRVNEHMKTRHGWPRGRTQPGDNRHFRSSGPSAAHRKRSVHASTYADHLADQPSSPKRSTRARRLTAKGLELKDSQDEDAPERVLEPLTFKIEEPSKQKRRSRPLRPSGLDELPAVHHLETDQDAHLDSSLHKSADARRSTGANSDAADSTDHAMVEIITEYVNELKAHADRRAGDQVAVDDDTSSTISTCQKLLDDDCIKFNASISPEKSKELSSIYTLIAERYDARAHTSLVGSSSPKAALDTAVDSDPPQKSAKSSGDCASGTIALAIPQSPSKLAATATAQQDPAKAYPTPKSTASPRSSSVRASKASSTDKGAKKGKPSSNRVVCGTKKSLTKKTTPYAIPKAAIITPTTASAPSTPRKIVLKMGKAIKA